MHPNISFSCLEQNSCGNKRSRRAAASATRGWHDDSLPGAGFLYNSVPLDSVGWHGDSWVTEQACIARGSLRLTPLACLEMLSPLGVRQADGLLRARHGVDLLADEEIQGRIYSIQVPATALVGSQDEELAQGDVMALADEPTWRLPASGWAIFH